MHHPVSIVDYYTEAVNIHRLRMPICAAQSHAEQHATSGIEHQMMDDI